MGKLYVYSAILAERKRQEEIHPDTRPEDFPVVLTEEFLEVMRALQGEGDLKEELIQVASVCIRWLERI